MKPSFSRSFHIGEKLMSIASFKRLCLGVPSPLNRIQPTVSRLTIYGEKCRSDFRIQQYVADRNIMDVHSTHWKSFTSQGMKNAPSKNQQLPKCGYILKNWVMIS